MGITTTHENEIKKKKSSQDDAILSDGVKKLAALARIKVGDAELEKFTREFDAILAYVGQFEKLNLKPAEGGSASGGKPALRNVMRKDDRPHLAGVYAKKIVEQFPASEKNALVVKQIISHDEAE